MPGRNLFANDPPAAVDQPPRGRNLFAEESADSPVMSPIDLSQPPPEEPPVQTSFMDVAAAPAIGAVSLFSKSLEFLDALKARKEGGQGIRDTGQNMAVGIASEPIAGLSGIVQGAMGDTPDVEGMRAALMDKYGALTPEAAQTMQNVSEYVPQGVKDYGEAWTGRMNELADAGYEKGAVADEFLGTDFIAPSIAAAVKTAPTAVGVAAGMGGGRMLKSAAQQTAQGAQRVLPRALGGLPSKADDATAQLIQRGESHISTAGRRLPPADIDKRGAMGRDFEGRPVPSSWRTEKGLVTTPAGATGVSGAGTVKDKVQARLRKYGIDDGSIANIGTATPASKSRMQEAVLLLKRVIENKRVSYKERASDVLGRSLKARYDIIESANKSAAKQLTPIAKTLKGQTVNVNAPLRKFVEQMDELGVRFNIDRGPDYVGGPMRPLYEITDDAAISGLPKLQGVINRMAQQMAKVRTGDAYSLHQFKKFIDEGVRYGKTEEGLGGSLEFAFKEFRHNIDNALDKAFPAYNKVNTQFSETKTIIDELQRLLGPNTGLDASYVDSSVGTLMRRITSNAQSRGAVRDMADQIDALAKKYRGSGKEIVPYGQKTAPTPKINDDLATLTIFIDDLERMFGSKATNSFQGNIESALNKSARDLAAGGSLKAKVADQGLIAIDKWRGINEANAMKALQEALK